MSSMEGAIARRPGKPNRKGPDRKIYIGWIAIVWAAIISGFGLDFGRYMAERPGPPLILHLHAAVYVDLAGSGLGPDLPGGDRRHQAAQDPGMGHRDPVRRSWCPWD